MKTTRRRILLVVRRIKTGGIERATLNLAEGLIQYGHDVHLMILKGQSQLSVPDGVQVHHCDLDKLARRNLGARLFDVFGRGVLRFLLPGSGFVWRGLLCSRAMRDVIHALEQQNGTFDLILLRGQGVFESLWNFSHPALWQVVEGPPANFSRFWLGRYFYRLLYENKQVVAVSAGIWGVLVDELSCCHVQVRRHEIIHNALPIATIREQAQETVADLPTEPYLIHVARLNPVKNQALLLHAYAYSAIQLPLVIIGDGKERANLAVLANQLGIAERVLFLGMKANPYPYMAHAAAFILSSRQEGLGLVLIEALACGTQTVATDVPGGIREVLVDELQRLLAENSVDGLAEKMKEALEDPVVIRSEWAERFDSSRIIPLFLNLIDQHE